VRHLEATLAVVSSSFGPRPLSGTLARSALHAQAEPALSIAELYDQVEGALRTTFPGEVWVLGEVRKHQANANGHHFLELADPAEGDGAPVRRSLEGRRWTPVLNAVCWASTWSRVGRELEEAGVAIREGLVVRLRGTVGVFPGNGQLRLVVSSVDVASLLGRLAAARRALLEALEREGLLLRNRELAVPLVPLRVGLVTSAGSQALRDFLAQLDASGFSFEVGFAHASVQGPEAAAQVVAALEGLSAFGPDVVALVRGGGSRGDLSVFDDESVARAVALAPFPVWTGIGHSGDRSVVDELANRSFVTPTECGAALAARVAAFWDGTRGRLERIAVHVARSLDTAASDLGFRRSALSRAARAEVARREAELAARRETLERALRGELFRRASTLESRRRGVVAAVGRLVEREEASLGRRAERIRRASSERLRAAEHHVRAHRELLRAYDPARQLGRGWSLTYDEVGRLVRSVAALRTGDRLRTRLADGVARSVVESLEPSSAHERGADGT
jgi:exodeoxyribonuclease VII large subunit